MPKTIDSPYTDYLGGVSSFCGSTWHRRPARPARPDMLGWASAYAVAVGSPLKTMMRGGKWAHRKYR